MELTPAWLSGWVCDPHTLKITVTHQSFMLRWVFLHQPHPPAAQGTLGNVWWHFWLSWFGSGYGGVCWYLVGETREVVKHSAMHRTSPRTRSYPVPNVNWARVGSPDWKIMGSHQRFIFLIFIVIQLQLSAFSPLPSTPPQPTPPPSPTSTFPLDFVHVSFIVAPVNHQRFKTEEWCDLSWHFIFYYFFF